MAAPRTKSCTTSIDDPRGPLGIRVESSAAGAVRRVAGERPCFVLPTHASVLAFETAGLEPALLDVSSWLLVPAGQPVRLETRSPTASTIFLWPHPALARLVEEAYEGDVDRARMRRQLTTPWLAPRTTWVNEIAQRYAFERGVCEKRGNAATTFLEMELLKEYYFVRKDLEGAESERGERRSHLEGSAPLLERAKAWIDAHLGEPITATSLAKAMHASPSAVLRAFRQGVGMAPASYIRARRLDEALLLVRSGRYSVGEIASRVGYESFAAFSHAFHGRFGKPPSAFAKA